MDKAQAWFQIFQAALQGFINLHGAAHNQTAAAARALADESMQYLAPGVINVATNKVMPITTGILFDPADPIPPIEDDLEAARRQPTSAAAADPVAIEDDVSHATR